VSNEGGGSAGLGGRVGVFSPRTRIVMGKKKSIGATATGQGGQAGGRSSIYLQLVGF
jgi:hypothetical protein